jgi:hypothetical protein
VLLKLHTQLKTLMPPSTSYTNASANTQLWAFKTPYDTTQLELQAKVIKDGIRNRTALLTPTNRALNQLVKGCELAMNSTVLLAEENRQLQHENKRQKKKRAKRRAFIATGGTLIIQEGLNRS